MCIEKGAIYKIIKKLEIGTAFGILQGPPLFLPSIMPNSLTENLALNVLLVEDSLLNQKLMCAQLEAQNWVVVIATNGQEALDVMAKAEFDIVLMDVQMPVMDGLCATRLIRKTEAETGKHTPVVAVTAGMDSQSCLEAGMDDYLGKPVHVDMLYEKIHHVLKRTRSR